ncbi:hypothetical protein D3C73_1573710 [compost metagenome]
MGERADAPAEPDQPFLSYGLLYGVCATDEADQKPDRFLPSAGARRGGCAD